MLAKINENNVPYPRANHLTNRLVNHLANRLVNQLANHLLHYKVKSWDQIVLGSNQTLTIWYM